MKKNLVDRLGLKRTIFPIALVLGMGGCSLHKPEGIANYGEAFNQNQNTVKMSEGIDRLLACQKALERITYKNTDSLNEYSGKCVKSLAQRDLGVGFLEAAAVDYFLKVLPAKYLSSKVFGGSSSTPSTSPFSPIGNNGAKTGVGGGVLP